MVRIALVFALLSTPACGDDDTEGLADAPGGGGDGSGGGDDGGDGDGGGGDGGGGGVDANTTGIACGTVGPCEAGMQCCVTGDPGGVMTYECLADTATCMGASIGCDGPEDCDADERCCGSATGMMVEAECRGGGGMCLELCHASGDCSEEGDMCCPLPVGSSGICAAQCSFP